MKQAQLEKSDGAVDYSLTFARGRFRVPFVSDAESDATNRSKTTMMTTINSAATVRNAVTTIRYELGASAAANIDDDRTFAMSCFEEALLALYPNAEVTVVRSNVDASRMDAKGEIDGAEFVVARGHFGGASIYGVDVTRSVERAIDADDNDAFERACRIATESCDA